jgi:glycosyltransferase involved in cell wall biosynthesis
MSEMPFRIGLILYAGEKWTGGMEMPRSMALAMARTEAVKDGRVEVVLIGYNQLPEIKDAVANNPGVRFQKCARPGSVRQLELRIRGLIRRWPRLTRLERTALGLSDPSPLDFVFAFPHHADWPFATAHEIRDFVWHHYPSYAKESERDERNAWNASKLEQEGATHWTYSEANASEARRFFPGTRANLMAIQSRCSVDVESADGAAAETRERYGLPAKYLLVCNQFWRHKNYEGLFEVVLALQADHPDLVLACTGSLYHPDQPDFGRDLVARIHTLDTNNAIRILDRIPKGDQMALMSACHAVVQPALYEGWGFVYEEARALGKPILISDLPVHRERPYAHARFFVPTAALDLRQGVEAVWIEEPLSVEARDGARVAYDAEVLAFGARMLDMCGFRELEGRAEGPGLPSSE